MSDKESGENTVRKFVTSMSHVTIICHICHKSFVTKVEKTTDKRIAFLLRKRTNMRFGKDSGI